MVDNKILLSKINSNIWLFAATFSDSKKFILKKSYYKYLIGNLIVFAMNLFNIVKSRVEYYYYTNCS